MAISDKQILQRASQLMTDYLRETKGVEMNKLDLIISAIRAGIEMGYEDIGPVTGLPGEPVDVYWKSRDSK